MVANVPLRPVGRALAKSSPLSLSVTASKGNPSIVPPLDLTEEVVFTKSFSDKYKRVPLDQIKVNREARQRRELNLAGLKESIQRRGVMNPIIVTKDLELIAGERRLAASRELGLPDIPVRFTTEIPLLELHVIELEENLKRMDLDWRDETRALAKIHDLYATIHPDWSAKRTADAIGVSPTVIYIAIRVNKDLDSPKLKLATGVRSAYNILMRIDERAAGDALSDIIESTQVFTQEEEGLVGLGLGLGEDGPQEAPSNQAENGASQASPSPATLTRPQASPTPPAKPSLPRSADDCIITADFRQWAESYTGPTFNLIHCDFPYGIGTFDGAVVGERNEAETTYDDSADVYWGLIDTLCANRNRIMSHSAHIMFWLSAQVPIIYKTMETFRKLAPDIVFNPIPLIWTKSDGAGVIRDFRRKPKPTYEVCLLGAREDRFILKAVNNSYAAPTDKSGGQPTIKPEPMLRHFMEMVVDEQTRMLDPTCGSGSSLRAAESLRAKAVLGIERDPANADRARSLLRQFRTLRSV